MALIAPSVAAACLPWEAGGWILRSAPAGPCSFDAVVLKARRAPISRNGTTPRWVFSAPTAARSLPAGSLFRAHI